MAIEVISNLEPKNNGDFYLVSDIYLKGGYRVTQTLTDRNNITSLRRSNGMKVFVINENKEYQLLVGYVDNDLNNNANWKELSTSSTNEVPQYYTIPSNENGIVFRYMNYILWKQNIVSDIWILDLSNNVSDIDLFDIKQIYNININIIKSYNTHYTKTTNELKLHLFYENNGYVLLKKITNGYTQTVQL